MRATASLLTVAVIFLLGSIGTLHAQEHGEGAGASEHEYHRNHGATFLGATTHLEHDDTGLTIGTEYARRWGLLGAGLFVEMASSRLERDIIIGVPVYLFPWRGASFAVAPGAEVASATAEHGGETEDKLEFLLRFGTAYWFELNDTISIAPTFMADLVKGDWALVYGLSVGVGW